MTTRTTPPNASKRSATKAASAPKAPAAQPEPQRLDLPDHATPRPPAPMGRPKVWTPDRIADVQPAILDMIAAGQPITRICAMDGMPAWSTVRQWLRADPDFATDYARAREAAADHYAACIVEVAERVASGKMDPHAAKAATDAYKWAASKLDSKTYGDKIDLNANVTTTTTVGYVVRRYDDNPALQASQMIDVTPETPALQALHGGDEY